MKKDTVKHIAALLLFGSNGVVASHIALSSYEIVLFRTLVGSVLLGLIFLFGKKKPTFFQYKKDALFIALSGVAMGASWMFLYEAYRQVGVSVSTLLYYCGPVIVMVLSPLLFRERLTAVKILGFLAVLCGVFFVNGQTSSEINGWGVACVLLSALTYAVMVIANKKSERITGLENSLLQLVVSFVTVALFVGIKSGYSFSVAPEDWVWILILGALNTGVGCLFYFSSIGSLPVQTVAVCGYLEPLSAVVLSAVFLRETLKPLQILGAVLILGGALFGECVKIGKERKIAL